jgi:ubiquinone/menaquinone biosynthesis C-methylase UbiE
MKSLFSGVKRVLSGNEPAIDSAVVAPSVPITGPLPASDTLALLTCPNCHGDLTLGGDDNVVCATCDHTYPAAGVIDLLIDKSLRTALEDVAYDETAGYNDKTIAQIGTAWQTVFANAGIDPAGKIVLEVGAGTGALTVALLRNSTLAHIYATDISSQFLVKTIERAGDDRRVTAVRCDCNALPVRDDSCDLIVGRSILHHLLDYEQVLAQCARILRPGGKAVFFEPMLEGKLVVAMYCATILQLAERDGDTDLTFEDRQRIEKMVRHITKASWYPQTRDQLAKLEDKFIFTLSGMRTSGLTAGFSGVGFYNDNRKLDRSLWSNMIFTLKIVGIDPDKLAKYKFLSEGYARTFGAFNEFAYTPMGYLCFTK